MRLQRSFCCVLLCVCLLFGLCLISPCVAAAEVGAGVNSIDLGEPTRIYNDDEVYVTYDVPLDPFSTVYGQKVGEDTTSHILDSTYIQFSQDGTQSAVIFDSVLDTSELSITLGSNGFYYARERISVDDFSSNYDKVTHLIINGVSYEVTKGFKADSTTIYLYSTYGTIDEYPSAAGEYLVQVSNIDASKLTVYVTGYESETVTVSLGYYVPTNDYDFIYGSTYPLGWDDSGIKVIDVSDLRSGSSFDVTFDYRFDVEFDGSVSGGGLEFYAVFFDEELYTTGSIFFESLDFTATASSSRYTTTFVLPEDAVYFYIYVDLDALNVSECKSYSFVMTSLDLTVSMSTVESNSQMMTGIIDRLDALVDEALEANESLDEIIELLQQIIADLSSSGCDHSEIVELLERITGNQDQELTWLEKIWEAITSIPDQIGQTMQDLFVPSEEKVQEVIDKAEELVDEHLGGVVQAGEAVTQVVGAFTKQTTQETITFPSVTLTFSGVPWTFGGWEVDVIPDGFEFLFDALALVIDIIATIAFVNSMKTRWGKVMEG